MASTKTISLEPETKETLKLLKKIPEETYNSVVKRLIENSTLSK